MPIYEVSGPDGLTLELEGDSPPTESDLDSAFQEAVSRRPQAIKEPPLRDSGIPQIGLSDLSSAGRMGDGLPPLTGRDALVAERDALAGGFQEKTEPGGILTQAKIGAQQILPALGQFGHTLLNLVTTPVGPGNPDEFLTPTARRLAAPVKALREFSAEQARSKYEDVKSLETIGRVTEGPDIVRQGVSAVGSLAPTVAAGPLGLAGMVTAAGIQGYGNTYQQSRESWIEQGLSPGEADKKAVQDGVTSGLITAAVTAVGGRTGIEAFNNPASREAIKGGFREVLKEGAKNLGKQGGAEALEEATDQALQSVHAKLRYNPNLTLEQAVKDTVTAGGLGGFLGGAINVPQTISTGLDALRSGDSAGVNRAATELRKAADEVPVVARNLEAIETPAAAAEAPVGANNAPTAEAPIAEQPKTLTLAEKLAAAEAREKSGEDAIARLSDQEVVSKIEAVSKATGDQVKEVFPRGTTGKGSAYELGESLTSIDHLNALRDANTAPRPGDRMGAVMFRQFTREAIERATKSGSAQAGMTAEPALDYRKNPEVAKWLVENGKSIGIKPDSIADIQKSLDSPRADSTAVQPLVEESRPIAGGAAEPALPTVGMSAARAGELEPDRPFTTRNTVDQINKERTARGLGPIEKGEAFSNKQAVDEANRVLDDNPAAPEAILARLKEKPVPLEPVESAVMALHRADISNGYYRSLKKYNEYVEDGRMDLAAMEAANVDLHLSKLTEMDELVSLGGASSAAGKALQAVQIGIREDMSLDMMILKATRAKGGKLTIEEQSQISKENEALQRRVDDLEKLLEAKAKDDRETGGQEAVEEVVKTVRERTAKQKQAGVTRDTESEQADVLGRLKEVFKEDGSVTGQSKPVRKLMELLVEREGITERRAMEERVHEILTKEVDPTLTLQDTLDLMSGYGESKLPSQDFAKKTVRDINTQILQVRKLLDFFQGEQPKRTGLQRDPPSAIARNLIKVVNEAKKAFKLDGPSDPAKALKTAIESINTRLTNRISDLKSELVTRQKIVHERTPSPYNAETLRLRQELEETQKLHAEMFPKDKTLTDAQRLAIAEKSTDRQIVELERQLKSGEIFPKSKQALGLSSPTLDAAKARLEELKTTRDFARDSAQPKLEPDEAFLMNYLLRLRQRAAEVSEKTAAGDFAKNPKKEAPRSRDIDLARADVDMAKAEYQRGLEKFEWNKKTTFGRNVQRAWGAYDLLRTLMTTGEFSQVLRQGKGEFLASITSPARARIFGKSIYKSLVAMRSERNQRAVERDIFDDPLYAQAKRDKLYLPEHDSPLNRQEEFMMGRYSNVIPVVKSFNRAAETFLKDLRFQKYKLFSKSLTAEGVPTPEQGEVIARFINESTGRGSLGGFEQAAVAMNRAFFSVRYLTSRFQMLTGHALWKGDKSARKLVAQEYARIGIGLALYYTALLGFFNRDDKEKATVETDWRSSDFGKVKIGETRLDPLAGLAQWATLAGRTATGETKTIGGKIVPITKRANDGKELPYGRDDWRDYASRFLWSKTHPATGAAVNVQVGEDLAGEPASFTSELLESGPMTYYDIYDALRTQGLGDAAAISILGILGEGINTHKPK